MIEAPVDIEKPSRGKVRIDPLELHASKSKAIPLLTKQEEFSLSNRIKIGKKSYAEIIEIARLHFCEHQTETDMQKMLSSLRELCPAKLNEIVLDMGIEIDKTASKSESLLCTALSLAKQRHKIRGSTTSVSGGEKSDNQTLLIRIADWVDEILLPVVKNSLPAQSKSVFESKERITVLGNQARERMESANLLLVIKIARKYEWSGLPIEDLVGAGNEGLLHAVELFDGSLGFKFSTYAYNWIEQSIDRYIKCNANTIRIPVHVSNYIYKIRKEIEQIEQQDGKILSNTEAMSKLGLSNEEQQKILKFWNLQNERNLEDATGKNEYGDTASFGSLLVDTKAPQPFDELKNEEEQMGNQNAFTALQNCLQELFHRGELDKRKIDVINLRLGLTGKPPMNLEEIGNIYGVTRERIRQIEDEVLRKLYAAICVKLEEKSPRDEVNISAEKEILTDSQRRVLQIGKILIEKLSVRGRGGGTSKISLDSQIAEKVQDAFFEILQESVLMDHQHMEIITMRLGLNGESSLSLEDVGDKYGFTREYTRQLQSQAVAVLLKRINEQLDNQTEQADQLSAVEKNKRNYILELEKRAQFSYRELAVEDVLALLGQLIEQNKKEVSKEQKGGRRSPCLPIGNLEHIAGFNASLDLESFRRDEQAYDPEERSVEKIRALLSGRNGEGGTEQSAVSVDKMLEQRPDQFPNWMRNLSEQALARLFTILERSVSPKEVRDFFEQEEISLSRAEMMLLIVDCVALPDAMRVKLGNWSRRREKSDYPLTKQIRNPEFLSKAEKEKVFIPNLRHIIRSHFDQNPKELEERLLLVPGGYVFEELTNLFGNVNAHSLQNILSSISLPGVSEEPSADVILLDHRHPPLRFQEDEQVLLWSLDKLQEDGIAIIILDNHVITPASKAHVRKKFSSNTRTPTFARYVPLLRGRGYNVQAVHSTLNITSNDNAGMEVQEDIMQFFLENNVQRSEEHLQQYIQSYVKDNSELGNKLSDGFVFLVVRKNGKGQHTPFIPADKTEYKSRVEKEQDLPPDSSPMQESIISSSKPATKERKQEFRAPQKRPRSFDASVRESDECRMIRQKIGKLFGLTYRTRPWDSDLSVFRKRKKGNGPKWMPEFTPSEKNIENNVDKLWEYRKRLNLARSRDPYEVTHKLGEIDVNGEICVSLSRFANAYDLDPTILEEVAKQIAIEPRGYALAGGHQVQIYSLSEVCNIPYVKERLNQEIDIFTEDDIDWENFAQELEQEGLIEPETTEENIPTQEGINESAIPIYS